MLTCYSQFHARACVVLAGYVIDVLASLEVGAGQVPEGIALLQECAHFLCLLIDCWLWSNHSAVLVMHGSILNDLHTRLITSTVPHAVVL